MIFVWRGFGFLVPVVAFACLLFTQVLTNAAFADAHYYQSHDWPKLIGVPIAAIALWFLGNFLNSKPSRVLIDPATGEQVLLKNNHAMFFIPIQYWGPILFVIGLFTVFDRR